MMNKVYVSMTPLIDYTGNRAHGKYTNVILRGDGTMFKVIYAENLDILEYIQIRGK